MVVYWSGTRVAREKIPSLLECPSYHLRRLKPSASHCSFPPLPTINRFLLFHHSSAAQPHNNTPPALDSASKRNDRDSLFVSFPELRFLSEIILVLLENIFSVLYFSGDSCHVELIELLPVMRGETDDDSRYRIVWIVSAARTRVFRKFEFCVDSLWITIPT